MTHMEGSEREQYKCLQEYSVKSNIAIPSSSLGWQFHTWDPTCLVHSKGYTCASRLGRRVFLASYRPMIKLDGYIFFFQ